IGYTKIARSGPETVLRGVLETEPGRRIAVLWADAADTLRITALDSTAPHAEAQEIPLAHLDGGLLAVTVPADADALVIENAHGRIIQPLPRPVPLAGGDARLEPAPAQRRDRRAPASGGRVLGAAARRLGLKRS